jgi:hypothetical protein
MSELPLDELLTELRQLLNDLPTIDGHIPVWPIIDLLLDWGGANADRKTVAHFLLWKLPKPSSRSWFSTREVRSALAELETQ